ncbi:MAG: hypothetical protein DRP01_07090 [Archaeoglobales archaeon]|nr:MAG: hypothetical protein DRP01_07090 [Archaeoglobales archaeon]
MKKQSIWMAVVNAQETVVFSKGCQSQRKAESAIVKYLRKHEDFDGADFSDAYFWIGENDLRLDLMVFEIEAENFNDVQLHTGLLIQPPPDEKQLYRVVYAIDVVAGSALKAATVTYNIMTDPDSLAPVLEVIGQGGKVIKIDLSKNQ